MRHPLVSDVTYGGAAALGMKRQALHAARLTLRHPITGTDLDFECAAPADLSKAWTAVARR